MRVRNAESGGTKKRLISVFPGGGARGLASLLLLMAKYGPDYKPADHSDLLVGTSVGGLAVGCFAKGYSIRETFELYNKYLPSIFSRNWTYPVFAQNKYSSAGIEEFLDNEIGDIKLKDCPPIIITAFSTKKKKGTYFKNYKHPELRLKRVMRATMAANTYFPYCHIEEADIDDWFTDGGVTGNNDPSLVGYVEAIDPDFAGWFTDHLVIETFGCGSTTKEITDASGREPCFILSKAMDALDALLLTSTPNVERAMRAISLRDDKLEAHIYNPILSEEVALDDLGKLSVLKSSVMKFVKGATGIFTHSIKQFVN